MGIYARRPWRLLGQLTADIAVVAWGIIWWFVGRFVDGAVRAVAVPARRTAETASSMGAEFRTAASQAGAVPVIGDQLRRPFDGAADSLGGLAASVLAQAASIERLATIVGWLVFIIPVAIVVAIWLPNRVRFFVRARAAQLFIDSAADLDLFALRAMATQPMQVLARISSDPVSAWRRGDTEVISQLAGVELKRVGLKPPPAADLRPSPPSVGSSGNYPPAGRR